ncbi:hypothetical protein KIPB_014018, partial [Kipferlia bialata]|eukprot:g14018.t1
MQVPQINPYQPAYPAANAMPLMMPTAPTASML